MDSIRGCPQEISIPEKLLTDSTSDLDLRLEVFFNLKNFYQDNLGQMTCGRSLSYPILSLCRAGCHLFCRAISRHQPAGLWARAALVSSAKLGGQNRQFVASSFPIPPDPSVSTALCPPLLPDSPLPQVYLPHPHFPFKFWSEGPSVCRAHPQSLLLP